MHNRITGLFLILVPLAFNAAFFTLAGICQSPFQSGWRSRAARIKSAQIGLGNKPCEGLLQQAAAVYP